MLELCFLNYARRHYIMQQSEEAAAGLSSSQKALGNSCCSTSPSSLCSPCLPSLNEPGRQSCGPQPRSEHREPSVGRERLHGDQSVTQNHTPCPACSPSLRKKGTRSVYEGKHSYTSPLLFPSLTHCLHKIILWNIFFTLIHRRGREEEREGEKEGGGGGGKSTSSLSSTNKICMSSPSYLKHRVLFCFYPPRWGL